MFDYPVMNEEQAMQQRFSLLPDGEYEAVIKKVTAKVSSTGNNMYEVDLDVYDHNGCAHQVRDYLIFTMNMMWKVIHCAVSSGTLEEYEQKKLTPEVLEHKNVRVSIKTQEGNEIPENKLKGKPLGTRYPAKNVVEDYLQKNAQAQAGATSKAPTETPAFEDSDIPF